MSSNKQFLTVTERLGKSIIYDSTDLTISLRKTSVKTVDHALKRGCTYAMQSCTT